MGTRSAPRLCGIGASCIIHGSLATLPSMGSLIDPNEFLPQAKPNATQHITALLGRKRQARSIVT